MLGEPGEDAEWDPGTITGMAPSQDALSRLIDRLDVERGPLDTAEDEAEIRRIMGLLGGPVDDQFE